MDRSKWEYKKLGDVCAPKTDILRANKLFGKDDVIEYIDISSIDNSAHYITQPISYLFHEAPSRAQQKVEQGDILYSLVRPNLKNIAVVTSSNTEKYVASSGFCVLRSKDIDNTYLYHLVLSNPFTDYILGLVSGANYPAVREDDVKGFSFSCPPISDQQRIVAELDCLNEMIAVKQEQLKEFDKFAQSIFYDMFGDPISNEKGWDIIKLGDICTCITKGTTPTTLGFPFVEEGINFVKVESFVDGKIDTSKLTHITQECNLALSRSQLESEDLLICIAGATIGKMAFVDTSILPANTNQACAIIRLKNKKTLRFIRSFMAIKLKNDIVQMGKGVAQPNLSLGQLRDFVISFPPIALQQQFADKISAIEAQKELVKQSIAETQSLLDYTMDKYFG